MARYSIEEAVLATSLREGATGSSDDTPIERLMVVASPYVARKISLYGAVGTNCGCTVIDIGADDTGVRRVALIGFRGDVERTEMLITSLLVQMTRSMLDDKNRPRSGTSTAAWRRSFITGFAARVAERLSEARSRASQNASSGVSSSNAAAIADSSERVGAPSVAMVLAKRDDEVDAEVRRRYPHLRSRRMDGGSSAHGHQAGLHAGDRANLGAPEFAGRRALHRWPGVAQ